MKSPKKIRLSTQVIVFAALVLDSYSGPTSGASTDSGVDSITLYSLVLPFVLVLAAAVGATILLRRWRGSFGRRDGPLQLVHVIALGPRERLALVKVGRRYLVVGITSTQINRVAELDELLDDSLAGSSEAAVDKSGGPTGTPPV
jgi:flagellar protein FliO/FliZ